LVACSVLVAIGVGAGVIAAGALPAGATGPRSFAHTVLGEAIVPPGARLTTKVASTWLESPLETPGFGGLIDLHRLYLLDEPPASVESYIEAHLPKGANVTSNETNSGPMGTATGFVVSLSTSGPHEYLAQLAYDLVPVGATNDTELRVDSQTVWLPSRSAGELAPAGDIVEVTGFSQTGFAYASSGPVTVRLDNAQATKLRAVFDSLQLGPAKTGCMESSLLYKVTFRPAAGPASSFEADGWGCDREATVTGHGKRMSPLYDKNCSLLRDVIEVLPSHRAEGTRDSLGRCRT
jgi:hypothetical protein